MIDVNFLMDFWISSKHQEIQLWKVASVCSTRRQKLHPIDGFRKNPILFAKFANTTEYTPNTFNQTFGIHSVVYFELPNAFC